MPDGTATIAQSPEDLRARVKEQTVAGKPAFFKLEAQLPQQGRTDTPLAASDKMWVVLKTYAADGENGLHAHPNEDHTFVVLQGEATRFAADHPVFMAQVTIQARSSRCEPGLWDLFHVAALEEGADGRFEASAPTFVMRPRSRGSVRLASVDPRVPPVVDHGLFC